MQKKWSVMKVMSVLFSAATSKQMCVYILFILCFEMIDTRLPSILPELPIYCHMYVYRVMMVWGISVHKDWNEMHAYRTHNESFYLLQLL